jgi:hypothetical protein
MHVVNSTHVQDDRTEAGGIDAQHVAYKLVRAVSMEPASSRGLAPPQKTRRRKVCGACGESL